MKKFFDRIFKNVNPLALASAALFGSFALGLLYIKLKQQRKLITVPQLNPQGWYNKSDNSSLSNLDDAVISHSNLKYEIDFKQKVLRGYVTHCFTSMIDNLDHIILDCKNISIRTCTLGNEDLPYKLCISNEFKDLGDFLYISLPQMLKKNEKFNIDIEFESIYSENDVSAINWLTPQQTLGKKYQYMFTQCQPIYCRTLFPCQDSPAVKATYKTEVSIEDPYRVYISGTLLKQEPNKDNTSITYFFEQNVPIPSYLYAIVAGNLKEQKISERTSVISEPEYIENSAKEFEDMETYLKSLETYLINYRFQDYKIVILPPSFPYGGMENPQLTFASPTLIVGDKSQTDVVIHEMAHSWSGNLVSCKNWEHFWLNEGLTVFIESKIIKQLHGDEALNIFLNLGNGELITYIKQQGEQHNYTKINPQLEHKNPDDAFSIIPYQKGCQVFYELERLIGGEVEFQNFLRSYFEFYEKKSVDTDMFFSFLNNHLLTKKGKEFADNFWNQFNIDQWVKQPGFLPVDITTRFKSTKIDQVNQLVDLFFNTPDQFFEQHQDTFKQFDVQLKVIFLKKIVDQIEKTTVENIRRFDQVFQISANSKNCEINVKWLEIAITIKYTDAYQLLEHHLATIGRMKYLKPLYRALCKSDIVYGKKLFAQNEKSYHSIAVLAIKSIFKI